VAIHFIADLLKGSPTVDNATLVSKLRASGPQSFPPLVPFDLGQRSTLFPAGVNLYATDVMVVHVANGAEVGDFGGNFVDSAKIPAAIS
jgi:hypothetical protein